MFERYEEKSYMRILKVEAMSEIPEGVLTVITYNYHLDYHIDLLKY